MHARGDRVLRRPRPGPEPRAAAAEPRRPLPTAQASALAVVLSAVLAACAVPTTVPTDHARIDPVVTGTASYREPVALPPGAMLHVVLEDVPRAGAAATTLARSTIDATVGPPYRFTLTYDPARIDAAARYAVRAAILVADERWFMSEQAYPVITSGHPNQVTITLVNSGHLPDLVLPGSYVGTLACRGCTDAVHHVDLWADGAVHVRRRSLEGDVTRDDLGRWRYRAARQALVLHLGDGETLHLEVLDQQTVRVLDPAGRTLPAGAQDLLTSDGRLHPSDLELALAGELRVDGDGTTVLACASGRRYPVEARGDAPSVQAAYAALAPAPGAPLFVTLEAQLGPRPSDGEPAMVVRRLIGSWDDLDCDRATPTPRLRGTPWRLVRLGDAPVATSSDAREPNLVLDTASGRFRSTIGCNAITGGHAPSADALRFLAVASTRRACPPALAALERAWTDALDRTSRYRILSTTLELFDDAGESLALLIAADAR